MTVQVSPDTDPAQLRTELTAAVMVPRSWVISRSPGRTVSTARMLPSNMSTGVPRPRHLPEPARAITATQSDGLVLASDGIQ